MPDLTQRSYKKELLDGDDIPFADIKKNMQELNTINRLLGGHRITVAGIRQLAGNTNNIQVCEIGCGGGDNLQAIQQYCSKHFIRASYTGIDIKAACIGFAKEQYPGLPAAWIVSDYASVSFKEEKPAIIFSSLFCHHFTEAQLIEMLQWMNENSRTGFFINDLHRHPLAYYSIKWITALFSKSYLVKNDAPLSVARGFRKKEWIALLNKAGITQYSIRWHWAFRYLVTVKK